MSAAIFLQSDRQAYEEAKADVLAMLERDRNYWQDLANKGKVSEKKILVENRKIQRIEELLDRTEEYIRALYTAREIYMSPRQELPEQSEYERQKEAHRRECRRQGRDTSHLPYLRERDFRTYPFSY